MPALKVEGKGRVRRQLPKIAAVIIGCIVAGGAAGFGVRWWASGLNGQRAQLHECVVASQQAHPNEDPGNMLAHLQAEVPDCMTAAGYTPALDNHDCGRTLWQGDVYCYVPKSWMGGWLFRIATFL